MKIVKAQKLDGLTYVHVISNGVQVVISRAGPLSSIATIGRGNVRFTKAQAKLIASML